MKALRILPVVVVLLLLSNTATANFGLGPCCPPSVCGIIPCDSGCAGQAITQMGSSVSAALNALQSAYEQQSQATNDTAQSVNSLSQNLIQTLNDTHQDYLRGLDASTARIEASVSSLIPVKEGLSEHKINSIKLIVQKYFATRSAEASTRDLGPMGQPVSGEIAPNRADSLKAVIVASDQMVDANIRDYFRFQSNSQAPATGSNSLLTASMEQDIESFNNPASYASRKVLSLEEEQYFQRLFAYIVSTKPAVLDVGSENYEKNELDERRRAAINAILYEAFLVSMKYRVGAGAYDWQAAYEDLETNDQGETSLYEVLRSDTDDRINNAEWWGTVKRSSHAGLNRELSYLNASNSMLRNLEYDVKAKAAKLTSLLLLENM